MIKKINYFFQAIIIYLFFIFGKFLGINLSRKLFSFLFSKVGPFFKSKKIINKNIEIFSKYNPGLNKDKIINDMWKNYGMTFIEYIFLKYLNNNIEKIIIKDKENLNNVINGQPVIFVSGHFANFELMSMRISNFKIKLATIYRPLNNFFINPFMEYLRKKYVCNNQIKKGINGVRDAIEFIKKDFSIALMIDQRVSEGEKIDFFGKTAFTTTLPAQLALKYKLKIIPVFIQRDRGNNFQIEFQKEIDPVNYHNKIELTKKLNKTLENMVIRNPGQWIWTHNRWK